ncbi:cell shape determination protein CcmA [Solemya pervernicosa gill symbiont]|uniref:Cell shape determination protein CcmA n=2 Tax=Gammaproteobacteria incertae sedis TaxID=118884 RepID=A0A1T2L567_9GAMM|nr:polymer-forming cytoskeletal protein [Candidatus Reidiella endopervernicosa]OOZ40257.1 cell shape determination protein CcmA [Solemya pervernicosa gill symbiont]QKQ26047.1 polymer-forming cytoskeletal protein [Candidatus Reidiella endopervernicosa]
MLGKSKKKKKTAKINSLIGTNTEVNGDVIFNGGLHVDGKVKGNVISHDDASVLTLSDQGMIEGEVKVPNVVLNGRVVGNVYAFDHIELASKASVTGNVYYDLLEMAMGAEVNGSLVHQKEPMGIGERPSVKEISDELVSDT